MLAQKSTPSHGGLLPRPLLPGISIPLPVFGWGGEANVASVKVGAGGRRLGVDACARMHTHSHMNAQGDSLLCSSTGSVFLGFTLRDH